MKVIEVNYCVDYFEFSFNHKIEKVDIENRFKFDLLSVYPGKIVFTLTAALTEESSSILMKYSDFWLNKKLGITFAKKYNSAINYINDRMAILNKGVHKLEQNYEYQIYTSKHTNDFINYLTSDLSMHGSGKNSYIVHRKSDADYDNRLLFRSEIIDSQNFIYKNLRSVLNFKDFTNMSCKLIDLADDKKIIFQRGNIVHEVEANFPQIGKGIYFLQNIIDNIYNKAMAQSANAIKLSTENLRINGIGLTKFLYSFDKELYLDIQTLTPHQLFKLAEDRSWQLFIDDINALFVDLIGYKNITQNTNITKYVNRNIAIKTTLKEAASFVLDCILGTIAICVPLAYALKKQIESKFDPILNVQLYRFSKYYYLAMEIHERSIRVKGIVKDIKNGKFE